MVWCRHALARFNQRPAAHHQILIKELQAVASGETDRLMVLMPPGSAKSTYASVLFPSFLLARPNRSIIGASNSATLAEQFSRRVQNEAKENAATLGYSPATISAELWHTDNGGQYRAAGVGGTVTGFRADYAILDDPIRGREDAESETIREKTWNWYRADLTTRLKPGGAIVLIQTRWHQDDLAGRLLEVEGDKANGGRWRVVSIPAQAVENDPLGREPGEWLWSDDEYGYGELLRLTKTDFERAGAMRDWSALYQQTPTALEGSIFKVAQIATIDTAPAGKNIVRGWDLAATEQTGTRDPDWTVGVKFLRNDDGRFIVLDVVRFRGGPDEVEAAIVNTAHQDGHGVRISIPQDPGQAGKQQVLYLTRKLAGYRVESSTETGDKATRASPVASQVNVGNLAIVRAPWNRSFLDELAAFPSGTKDDQVDALSRAFSVVGMNHGPMRISDMALRNSARPA